MWEEYFQDLGDKYIAAGDYNSKHTLWGSRNTTPRGRTLEKYIRNNNLNILSTGTPTYWPTDLNKKPDLLDITVTRGINTNKLKMTTNLEFSSDHTPIIIEYRNKPILYSKPETLCNKTTKWQTFKEIIKNKINCNTPLKTPEHIEQAIATSTATIQEAARTTTTPESTSRQTITIPQEILDKIREKRKVKTKCQKHRTRENKRTPKQTCKGNKKQNKRAEQ